LSNEMSDDFIIVPQLLEGKREVCTGLCNIDISTLVFVACLSLPWRQAVRRSVLSSPECCTQHPYPQVFDLPLCKVLLIDDSNYPCWLVLVPRVHGITEVIDLTPEQQATMWQEVSQKNSAPKAVCEQREPYT
jgi:hypothetical protein